MALTSTPEPGSAHWLLAIGAAASLHAGVLFWQIDPGAARDEVVLPPSEPMLLPAAELPRRDDVAAAQPVVPEVATAEVAQPVTAAESAEPLQAAEAAAPVVQAAASIEPTQASEPPLAVAATTVAQPIAAQSLPATIAASQEASPVSSAQVSADVATTEAQAAVATVNTPDPAAAPVTTLIQPTEAATALLAPPILTTPPQAPAAATVLADDIATADVARAPARIVSSTEVAALAQSNPAPRQPTSAAAVTTAGTVPLASAASVPSPPAASAAVSAAPAIAPAVSLPATGTTPVAAATAAGAPPTIPSAAVVASPPSAAAPAKPVVVATLPQEPAQAAASIEEAPTVDETLTTAIDAFLAQEECARIDREPGSTTVAALVTSDESRERLQTQLATETVGAPVELQIDVVQPSFCPALLTLPIAVEGGEQMALNNDDGLYLDGELLALSIGPVPVSGHLYVVFVDHDSSIQYLVPSEFEKDTSIDAGATRELGAEQDILDVLEALGISIGNWRVSPPYGRGLIMAFVTADVMDPAPSDAETDSADYFVALGESLDGNPALWARYRWIDTRPSG